MIKSYKEILKMNSIVSLKIEQDKKALRNIEEILYINKDYFLDKIIIYIKKELNLDYFKYKIIDIDENIVDILVKKDSKIFKKYIEEKEYLNFNAEELITNKIYKNKDEIIIVDIGFDENLINLSYICDSLNYKNLSYSEEIKKKISNLIDYVLEKNINKKIKNGGKVK